MEFLARGACKLRMMQMANKLSIMTTIPKRRIGTPDPDILYIKLSYAYEHNSNVINIFSN